MESSKNFDIPPVLKPDFERRLVRAFAFLRQHDRKARLAKKIAELNVLKDEPKRTPPAAVFSGNVAQGGPKHDSCENQPEAVSSPTPTHNLTAEHTRETVVKILEDEIEELRKAINFKDFDTIGSISASDLSSALRALNRPTPKVSACAHKASGHSYHGLGFLLFAFWPGRGAMDDMGSRRRRGWLHRLG
jgi:hypothetical protein